MLTDTRTDEQTLIQRCKDVTRKRCLLRSSSIYLSAAFERRGIPDRRGGLSGPPPPGAPNERSPDLRGLRVLQSRNPPTSGPSFFGRLGGGAPLGLAAQQGNFKQPEISLMLDCEDDPLSPAQMDRYRKLVGFVKMKCRCNVSPFISAIWFSFPPL